jgi:hypothetical protein
LPDAAFVMVKNPDVYHTGFDFSQRYGAIHVDHTWTLE